MKKDVRMIIMGYSVLVIALVAFGIILFVQSSDAMKPGEHSKIPWEAYSEERMLAAQKAGKPVLIQFYAIWCDPCREMDYQVYSRQEVADAATNYVTLRVDVSDQNNEFSRQVAEKYSIIGLPVLVFVGTNGQERINLRLLGKEEPARLIQRLKAAQ